MVGVVGIQPEYFLDEMSSDALALAWDAYQKSCRDSWEQTRWITYYTAAPYLKDKPTMKQFMPLAWDSEEADKPVGNKQRFDELTAKLNLN